MLGRGTGESLAQRCCCYPRDTHLLGRSRGKVENKTAVGSALGSSAGQRQRSRQTVVLCSPQGCHVGGWAPGEQRRCLTWPWEETSGRRGQLRGPAASGQEKAVGAVPGRGNSLCKGSSGLALPLVEEASRSVPSSLLRKPPWPLIPPQGARFQGSAEVSPPITAGWVREAQVGGLCAPQICIGHILCTLLVQVGEQQSLHSPSS